MSTSQDPSSLAAQLQALSMLSKPQENRHTSSDTSQHSSKWAAASTDTSPPRASSLPQGWMQLTDPENRVLYHNYVTGHTQYTLPSSQPLQEESGLSTSAPSNGAESSNGLTSLGHRSSVPPVAQGQGEDSLSGVLGSRLSGPAAFGGGVSQRGSKQDTLAALTDGHTAALDSQYKSLGQRMPDPDFKIGKFCLWAP